LAERLPRRLARRLANSRSRPRIEGGGFPVEEMIASSVSGDSMHPRGTTIRAEVKSVR
jgi:hypothetical protein